MPFVSCKQDDLAREATAYEESTSKWLRKDAFNKEHFFKSQKQESWKLNIALYCARGFGPYSCDEDGM